MKASQIIADELSAWRSVQSAPDLAHQMFHLLDADERERLAMSAFTDQVRRALRRKNSRGVPAYSSIEKVDPATGDKAVYYKQTALFSLDDYQIAVAAYLARAQENRRTAVALAAACKDQHGVNPMRRGRAA